MFHLEKLKDLICAKKYAVRVCNRFGVLESLENPEEIGDTFKRETLKTAKERIGKCLRSQSGFALVKMLEGNKESRVARLARLCHVGLEFF